MSLAFYHISRVLYSSKGGGEGERERERESELKYPFGLSNILTFYLEHFL